MMDLCFGERCWIVTYAILVSARRLSMKPSKASSPPAEAPIPTTVRGTTIATFAFRTNTVLFFWAGFLGVTFFFVATLFAVDFFFTAGLAEVFFFVVVILFLVAAFLMVFLASLLA